MPPYLSQKLTRLLVTKDGGTPRAVKDARASAVEFGLCCFLEPDVTAVGRLKRKVTV